MANNQNGQKTKKRQLTTSYGWAEWNHCKHCGQVFSENTSSSNLILQLFVDDQLRKRECEIEKKRKRVSTETSTNLKAIEEKLEEQLFEVRQQREKAEKLEKTVEDVYAFICATMTIEKEDVPTFLTMLKKKLLQQ